MGHILLQVQRRKDTADRSVTNRSLAVRADGNLILSVVDHLHAHKIELALARARQCPAGLRLVAGRRIDQLRELDGGRRASGFLGLVGRADTVARCRNS